MELKLKVVIVYFTIFTLSCYKVSSFFFMLKNKIKNSYNCCYGWSKINCFEQVILDCPCLLSIVLSILVNHMLHFNSQIKFVILLSVNHTILIMLVQRI